MNRKREKRQFWTVISTRKKTESQQWGRAIGGATLVWVVRGSFLEARTWKLGTVHIKGPAMRGSGGKYILGTRKSNAKDPQVAMGSVHSTYRKMSSMASEKWVRWWKKGEKSGKLGRGQITTLIQARCCVKNGLQGESRAIRRPVRRLLGKKMGGHKICHPNQDTCASAWGCYTQSGTTGIKPGLATD